MPNQVRKIEFTGLQAQRIGATHQYFLIKIGGHKVYLPLSPYRILFKMACQRVLNLAGHGPPFLSLDEIGETKVQVNNKLSKLRRCLAEKNISPTMIRWTPSGIMLGADAKKIIFNYHNLMESLDESDKILLQGVADVRPRSIK